MGTETYFISSSPSMLSRPRFTIDLKTVPWTDGKGREDDYAENADEWESLHDLPQNSSSNKLTKISVELFSNPNDTVALKFWFAGSVMKIFAPRNMFR